MCMGRKCLSLFMIPIVREHLFAVFSICCFHCRCSSIVSPRKLKSFDCCIIVPSILRFM